MNRQKNDEAKDLDKELGILRDLIEKENEMLRKMINSLDALEKKMTRAEKKEGLKRKTSYNTS
jgi:hypothetical protein